MFGVARSALIRTLRDALPPETLTFGYDVVGIKDENVAMEKVWLKFIVGADRKMVEEGPFDVVIAADGINSALRPTVYGKKDMATFSGLNLFYGVADMKNVDRTALQYQDHSLVQNYGRGQSFIYYGLGPTLPSTNIAHASASHPVFTDDVFGAPAHVVWALTYRSDKAAPESWAGAATRAALEAVVAEGQWQGNRPLRALVDATALDGTDSRPAGLAHFGLFYRPPVAPWSRGGLVLLGDAAHATLPTLGQVPASRAPPSCAHPVPSVPLARRCGTPRRQGANMALDDAWSLATSLSAALAGAGAGAAHAAAVRRGLAAYEAQRLAKTSRIVKLSRTLGDVNHSRSAALCWLRDRLTGLLVGSGQLQRQMAAEIAAQPVLPLGPRP